MRILVAEDNVVFQKILESNLKAWGYEVLIASDGTEAWKILNSPDAPQLVILDWLMPGISGLDLCKKIRLETRSAFAYVILLTALHGEEELVAGMEAGANDYITKPFKPAELRVRLRAGRRIIELQNDLLQAHDALRLRATRDPLTGLWNHEEIFRLLDLELFRAERQNMPVAIVLADLDHFKKINDTYGHLAGDSVLRLVTQKIQALVRPYDSIGRYGGDEFLFVLPGCDRASALGLIERIRSNISAEKLNTADGLIPVTMSMGLIVYNKRAGGDAKNVLRDTDAALYRAKKNGRNQIAIVGEESPAAI